MKLTTLEEIWTQDNSKHTVWFFVHLNSIPECGAALFFARPYDIADYGTKVRLFCRILGHAEQGSSDFSVMTEKGATLRMPKETEVFA